MGPQIRATLFDATHNNPVAGHGGDQPTSSDPLATAGLAFDLAPDSVIILAPVR